MSGRTRSFKSSLGGSRVPLSGIDLKQHLAGVRFQNKGSCFNVLTLKEIMEIGR